MQRRARDSNPQPVSRQLISNQSPNHSGTLRIERSLNRWTKYLNRMNLGSLASCFVLDASEPDGSGIPAHRRTSDPSSVHSSRRFICGGL